MTALIASVRACIASHQLIVPGHPLVVAVSGGPDSLCLLHVLKTLSADLGVKLHVAHLDHMIRGAESTAEAAFVAECASAWGLSVSIETCDVPRMAREEHINLHAAARKARYAMLARVALQHSAQAVAVAHHADDQAETVLLHLLRGAGPQGLAGMRVSTPWHAWAAGIAPQAESQPALIRPLLETSRPAIEAYCMTHGLEPRHDSSNHDLHHIRNRIRHDLLPRLIEYNPHIVTALGRTARIMAEDRSLIIDLLDDAWPDLANTRPGGVDINGRKWRTLHPALQREALRRAYTMLGGIDTLGLEHVEQARALVDRGVGRQLELPGGLALTVGYAGSFTLGAGPELASPQLDAEELALPIPGVLELTGGWRIETAFGPAGDPEDAWTTYLDADRLEAPLVVRRRRPGDIIRLVGGSRRLQDLLVDAKIPRALRAAWPVIATSTAIVWVSGLRVAAPYRVSSATRRALRVKVSRE